MSATLTTKITTEAHKRGKARALRSSETMLNPGVVGIDGSGFDGEDEKGDFQPIPLAERGVLPSHPGAVLRDLYLPSAGLNHSQLAARLGVSRRTISTLINEQRAMTVDMANRLARAFRTTPDFWLKLQLKRDVWAAMREHGAEYEAIEPLVKAEGRMLQYGKYADSVVSIEEDFKMAEWNGEPEFDAEDH